LFYGTPFKPTHLTGGGGIREYDFDLIALALRMQQVECSLCIGYFGGQPWLEHIYLYLYGRTLVAFWVYICI